ncbi:MAG: creatininase family protein [Reyranella sp.]|uniref:creatininase family protein n=1 Tax=Reyranella sp. TaxID=1929291 RepID=UPI0011FAC393|nr:creatininase family protein [Reyranella sp.]TAJ41134.1 MAG: creatininase family protein [Reyranella sp.]
MTMQSGAWLEDLTWQEAKARFDAGAVVVVPVGAAAKAHGPHLPLKTDALTARALAQRLIERLPVVAVPVLGFGFYPAFNAFAGSQHLGAETFKTLVRELLGNLRSHGVRRIAILNTGVSTEKPLDEVAGELGEIAVLHMRLLGAKADSLFDNLDGGHADERETSVMLALEPRSVRMDRLAPEGDFKMTAATGDASRASAFKGERLLAARVDDMVAALARRWPDAF